jgi:hypothetical protein
MPPKKRKTDEDGDLPSEETEKKDPLFFPDVMNMDKPTLKSELNWLQVCIVENPLKTNLQEKLHAAYTDELMDKVAKYYQNYQHCYYAILQKNKKKSFVSFQCTQYKVTAPGLAETPWANYKACKKMIDTINHNTKKNVMHDMKNHVQSCPGKMFVNMSSLLPTSLSFVWQCLQYPEHGFGTARSPSNFPIDLPHTSLQGCLFNR